ncbi:MAG: quinolinate synthase NadA [Deltaproteobacteria bacterium]|jgi:quinolinate synthase|nr:quinolinate synthase NadA [Deltaproteobacteria bacterium]
MNVVEEIEKLKLEHGAVILAHNYTLPEIQDIADFVGDSLELSIKAKHSGARVIVFCGVRFMAETAKILSPESVVLHPDPSAGCPMADMAGFQMVKEYREAHPDTVLVAYVNTAAETKTLADICCTSGNAEQIIRSIPPEQEILFLPDANLGRNIMDKTGRAMELWPGYCPTHARILPEAILRERQAHPEALALVHPECRPAVTALADQALSTGGMLRFVRDSSAAEFIIGTEAGIIHRMRLENPGKTFISPTPLPICPNMKKIGLGDVLLSLRDFSNRIELTPETVEMARRPLERMLAVRA